LDLCKFNCVLPKQLIGILKKGNWIKTGVGIDNDINLISKNFNLGQCSGYIDMQTMFTMFEVGNPNLNSLSIKLNLPVHKIDRDNKFDWSKPLSVEDVEYCANDAYISYLLGKLFIDSARTPLLQKLSVTTPSETTEHIGVIRFPTGITNYVGALQEHSQQYRLPPPEYINQDCVSGEFVCRCIYNGIEKEGRSRTKKGAKTEAAKECFNELIKKEAPKECFDESIKLKTPKKV
jgi:hypothetical protein